MYAQVNILFEENKILDKENKRLLRLHKADEKHTSSASAKVRNGGEILNSWKIVILTETVYKKTHQNDVMIAFW